MTDTDNEWIEQARVQYLDINTDGITYEYFKQAILDNLPKPTEVVAPVDIEEALNKIKDIIMWTMYEADYDKIRDILLHLKGTTPVEQINQERVSTIKKKYKKRLTTDSIDVNYVIYKQVYNEFLDDITSLQSSEEKVEWE
jgi:hypothetical protein